MLKSLYDCKRIDLKVTQLKAASRKRCIKEVNGTFIREKEVKEEVKEEKVEVEKEEEVVQNVKDERLSMLEELFARDMEFLDEKEEELNKEMEENQRKRTEIERRRKLEVELLQRLEEFCTMKVEALKPNNRDSSNVQDGKKAQDTRKVQDRSNEEDSRKVQDSSNVQDNISSNKPDQPQTPPRKTYDFSRWKYTQLRDTINTSTDIEVLEGCRQEFQRRMTIYQDWKKKNDIRSISSQKTR